MEQSHWRRKQRTSLLVGIGSVWAIFKDSIDIPPTRSPPFRSRCPSKTLWTLLGVALLLPVEKRPPYKFKLQVSKKCRSATLKRGREGSDAQMFYLKSDLFVYINFEHILPSDDFCGTKIMFSDISAGGSHCWFAVVPTCCAKSVISLNYKLIISRYMSM